MGLSIWHWLIVLVVVASIFGTKRLPRIDDDSLRSQLHKELGRMPVYSAETTNGKEAEFIRDRLPKRFPAIVVLVVTAIFGVAAWWLTH